MSKIRRPTRRRGLFKQTLVIIVASVIILAGLLVGGVRLLDTFMPQYRNALADRIGERIDADIQIKGIELGWGWHGPILYLDRFQLTRKGASAPAVTAERVGLEFSLGDLLHGQRLPDGVLLNQPHLRLTQNTAGRWQLLHWSRPGDPPLTWARLAAMRARLSMLDVTQGRIDIDSRRLPNGHARLTSVDARLQHATDKPDHWSASLSAHGPLWWPRITARADVVGDMPQPHSALFQAHAQGLRPLMMAEAAGRLPHRLAQRLSGGVANIQLDGQWQEQRLQPSRAQLSLTAVEDREHARPLVPALNAVLSATSDRDARHIQIALSRLRSPAIDLSPTRASAAVDTRAGAIQASAYHLPSQLMARIVRLGAPQLVRAHVTLAIDNIRLTAGGNQPLQLAVGFHDLSIQDKQLTVGPIAGRYNEHRGQHRLVFSQAGGELAARRYLNGPLPVSDFDGAISWQRQPDGLHIGIDKLRLVSREASITANGSVRLRRAGHHSGGGSQDPSDKHGAPIVDLTADMSAPHVAALLQRIPQAADLPNPKLRDWLAKAITAGVLDSAHARIQGPMNHFPFANPGAGEGFHLTMTGHGVDVQYKPGWPALRQASGKLTLDGDTLDLALDSAKVLQFTLNKASAHVPDVREPVLQVTGQAHNALAQHLLAFLVQSPLRKQFGKMVHAVKLTGRDDLSLNLRVPLKPGLGDVKVSGKIDAHDNRLVQDALPGPITAINGHVDFDQQGLTAKQLTGNLLGVPLTVDLSPAADKQQRIAAHARPRLPADKKALAHYLPAAWLDYAHGQAPMTVDLSVDRDGKTSPIKVDSPLTGIAVTLPAPLSKPARTSSPLSVTINPETHRVEALYDHRLRVEARLHDNQPTRIQVWLNDHQLQPPDKDGVWIGGHTAHADAIGWFNVMRHVLYGGNSQPSGAAANDKAGTHKPTLAFLGGDLTIGRLTLGDRYFPDTHIRAEPMSASLGWRVNFNGPATQGQVTWTDKPDARMAIAGNLKRLALSTEPPSADNKASATNQSSVIWPDLSPMVLPRLKIFVQHFVVDQTDFGQAHLDATPLADGWRLNRFALKDGALTGDITAQWQRSHGSTSATARIDFDGHGLSRLLRTAGYVSPVQSKTAQTKAQLKISPNQAGLDLTHLNGNVHFALDNGTLLSVNPGPGRLLGLFNLYVLPRRLQLDFRDVVDKGMAFDKVRADFDIRQGQAYSKNLRINTPSSDITINGRIGLATRDYNEHVVIAPKLGSGVAIASALLGGPIVGAAVLAVQELLKKPIQHFSSIGYTLKGSWDDPQISDPSAND
ncbi:MAG: DUF3971 domain-containing protein [Salinisphaera sp.]|jgi:uncharacterized protein (TIGR02099 family)|nr:DUF3971 domain-containing protein [Salinisphaera sp.]